MTLTAGSMVGGDMGVGGYISTSPKATLRKVTNHNAANVALFENNPSAGKHLDNCLIQPSQSHPRVHD